MVGWGGGETGTVVRVARHHSTGVINLNTSNQRPRGNHGILDQLALKSLFEPSVLPTFGRLVSTITFTSTFPPAP